VLGALTASAPTPAEAQSLAERLRPAGYYLNVGTGSLDGPLTPAGVTDFQRLRLMMSPDVGPLHAEAAYEQSLELVSDAALALTPSLGQSSTGTGWLPLQWTIEDWEHGAWRHRFDRLSLSAPLGHSAELSAGRQPVSWATTLIFTPADPFTPFDPADPFREYRAGVDAARLQLFPGPFTELDFVLRLSELRDTTEVTALGRASTALGPWEISGWGGVLYGDGAAALAATLTAGGAAFRTEAEARWPDDVLRLSLGVDRSFSVTGRDLYVVLEYQHDGYGVAGPEGYLDLLASDPFARGELQVIGRNEAAAQASLQATPLVTVDVLTTWNIDDGSLLLTPAVSWSVSSDVTLRGGLFFGLGEGSRELPVPIGGGDLTISAPASEYGPVPSTLYLSLTGFF